MSVKHPKTTTWSPPLRCGKSHGRCLHGPQQSRRTFHLTPQVLCVMKWRGELNVMWKKLGGSETRPSDYYSIRFHLTIRACICTPLSLRLSTGGWWLRHGSPGQRLSLQTKWQICSSARKEGWVEKEGKGIKRKLFCSLHCPRPQSPQVFCFVFLYFFSDQRGASSCFITTSDIQ